MSPGPLRAFGLLAADAVRDALRRRVVLVVAFLTLLVVSGLDRCVGGGVFRLDDRVFDPAPYLAPGLFALLAGGVILLAGVLAADHLARPVEEGTASLWLARPVGRATYAAARLAGVVGIAWGAGVLVLGTAALLMHARSGLPLGPALRGALGCALGALVVAALSMAVSLWLPRLAALLLMLALVPWIFVLNGLALAGVEFEGPLNGSLQHLGPPLLTVILNGVMAWTPGLTLPEGGGSALVRLAVWAAIGVALLLAAFRRTELGR